MLDLVASRFRILGVLGGRLDGPFVTAVIHLWALPSPPRCNLVGTPAVTLLQILVKEFGQSVQILKQKRS